MYPIIKKVLLIFPLFCALNANSRQKTNSVIKEVAYPRYFDCEAVLKDGVLTVENAKIQRKYKWNNGLLQSISITNKKTGRSWALQTTKPDFWMPGMPKADSESSLVVIIVPETTVQHGYLQILINIKIGSLQVKRILRIYPQVPAIASDFYLQGEAEAGWKKQQQQISLTDLKNIEDEAAAR